MAKLGAPTMILNRAVRVEARNAAAKVLAMAEVEGLLLNEIMECARARLPEGCGRVKACLMGCALRRSIQHTYATGKSMEHVEARQEIRTGLGTRVMRFWFSTARVGDKVLLRIDRVEKVPKSAEPISEVRRGVAARSSGKSHERCGARSRGAH